MIHSLPQVKTSLIKERQKVHLEIKICLVNLHTMTDDLMGEKRAKKYIECVLTLCKLQQEFMQYLYCIDSLLEL